MNIQTYLPFIERIVLIAAILWQRENIKAVIYSMLSEPGSGGISSKRVITISSTATLLYLMVYTTHKQTTLDSTIMIVLVVLILTAAAIATLPQIMELVNGLKNFANKQTTQEPDKQTLKVTTEAEVTQQP